MPVFKSFEYTIPFTEVRGHGWLPLVSIKFVASDGSRFALPLIFDTAATQITLRPDYQNLFPSGQPAAANVAGNKQAARGVETTATIEFLGQAMTCAILFLDLGEPNLLFAGLFGRECFKPFGFGFWESARELYVALKP